MSGKYVKYIRYYLELCSRSDLLTNPEKMKPGKIKKVSTDELLGNYQYFRSMTMMISSMFTKAHFCKESRLMTNVIFLLLNDIMDIYRIFHNHITEILERFPDFNAK